jgi:hypothetical protein
MVAVPVRCAVAVLAATATDTVPLPLPLVPPAIVSQPTLLVAFHAHEPPAVTLTLVVSPAAAAERVEGDIA